MPFCDRNAGKSWWKNGQQIQNTNKVMKNQLKRIINKSKWRVRMIQITKGKLQPTVILT